MPKNNEDWTLYIKRRQKGLCVDCGEPAELKAYGEYYTRCEKCRKKRCPTPTVKEESLCWSCTKAVPQRNLRRCPWAEERRPVLGWDAIPTQQKIRDGVLLQSYRVKACPLYEKWGRYKNAKISQSKDDL